MARPRLELGTPRFSERRRGAGLAALRGCRWFPGDSRGFGTAQGMPVPNPEPPRAGAQTVSRECRSTQLWVESVGLIQRADAAERSYRGRNATRIADWSIYGLRKE